MDDAATDVTDPAAAGVRRIPLDLIDDDGNDMRRIATPPALDAALVASIRIHGILQPIGVRPNGKRYEVVFGRRRLRCARACGLPRIPADVQAWTDEAIRAVQVTENMQRAAPHPIDIWRSVCDLTDAGATIEDAAEEIGLGAPATRRMQLLGRLHPAILKLVELDMPRDSELRTIANAPAKTQAAAVKGAHAKPGNVAWPVIAARCQVTRIARSVAIFDADAHPELWHEDLFAQPDDEDRFTTTDTNSFFLLQQAALEARVTSEREKKRRVELAEYDTAQRTVRLPKPFKLISTLPDSKLRRHEVEFLAVRPDGRVATVVAEDVAAKKAAEKTRTERDKERAKAAAPAAAEPDAGEVGADDDAAPEEPVAAKVAISKAGLELIAQAKTTALRSTLQEGLADIPLERMVALLLLALSADNIELRLDPDIGPDIAEWPVRHDWRRLGDITRQLLLPGGAVAEITAADARMHAGDVLARILGVSGPDKRSSYGGHSGAAAEWVGAAIDAGAALPRFDTEVFLATVNGETLRKLAQDAGIKSTGPVGALRTKLIGALPTWRPDAAQFGAPAPEAPEADA